MREPRNSYLPFGDLLQSLREQGFRIGPDTHILVQRLLNQYAEQQDYTPTEKLRYQLAAILAQSEEESRLFYEVFDQFVESQTYQGAGDSDQITGGKDQGTGGRNPGRKWWYALAALPLVVLGVAWLIFMGCPEGEYKPFVVPAKGGEQTVNIQVSPGKSGGGIGDFRFVDVPDSILINIGVPGSEWMPYPDSGLHYHFEEAGLYLMQVKAFFGENCELSGDSLITIPTIRRIKQVNFSYTENGPNNWTLRNQSSLYKGEPLRAWDSLQSVSLEWRVDGRTIGRGDSIEVLRSSTDTLEVQLRLTATWRDTTAIDSLTKKIYPFQKPELPSFRSKSDYHNPDLSDMLIQPEAGTHWPFWLMLAFLLSYAIYELIRAWQRKVLLDDAPLRGPPLRQPLELDPTPLDFFQTQSFYELTRRLRRRRTGEERRMPDVPASIKRTAEAGGFPEIAWQERTHPSQYLLLIEQRSSRDHLAQLFAEIARELESRDISVEVYFYEKEPQLCWRKHRRERIPIGRVLAQYPDYRLLIIGEGEALLQGSGSQLAEWTEIFDHWEERAWLSTRATEAWGQTEAALAQRFVVAPASQAGLESLVLQWQAEIPMQPRDWQRRQYEVALPQADNPDLITELRAYLGERGLRWLAACAWYPDVFWDLTLRLIKRLEAFGGVEEDQRPDLDELIRLFRLPWLRMGEMPRSLREALAAVLPEEQANAVRELLLRVIAQPRNVPPPDSYAAADRQVRVALFQYLNSQQDREARAKLKQAIDQIEPEDIEDQLSLHELRKTSSPLLLKLPARMFRGQVPFFGMWQKWRMAIWGIPLLIGLGLAYWGMQSPDPEAFEPDRPYTAAEIRLETPADSARWFMHQGYFQATDTLDTLATGFELFKQAFLLSHSTAMPEPGPLVSEGMLFEQALLFGETNIDGLRHNLLLSAYHEGLNLYRVDSLGQADDYFLIPGNTSEINSDNLQMERAWLDLGIGTIRLVENQASEAGVYLRESSCMEPQDSAFDSIPPIASWMSADTDFMALLRLRFEQSRDSTLGQVMECVSKIASITKADNTAWQSAASLNTINGYEEYLENFPEGKFIHQARAAIISLLGKDEGTVSIGDLYQGGFVITIDHSTGKGLIAYPDDSGPMSWKAAMEIGSQLGEGWRLPSMNELQLMYRNIGPGSNTNNIGDFSIGIRDLYWSSTSYDNNQARLLRFRDANATYKYSKDFEERRYLVRAIRDFEIIDRSGDSVEVIFTGQILESSNLPYQGEVKLAERRYPLDGQGRFRIAVQFPFQAIGRDSVSISVPDAAGSPSRTLMISSEPAPIRILLESSGLPAVPVTGRVQDADLNPIAGASVSAMGETTTTGPDGRFTLRIAPAAESIVFSASKAGYQSKELTYSSEELEAVGSGLVLVLVQAAASQVPPPERPEMVLVRGGAFTMGSEEGNANERPPHPVTVSDFYIGKYEVSNAQYAAFLNTKGNQAEGGTEWYNASGTGYNGYAEAAIVREGNKWIVKAGRENHPVNYVSWYGAQAYCNWLSEQTGQRWRMPTEAEWEYAAAGGQTDRKPDGSRKFTYSGSDNPDEVAWYTENTNDTGTRPVGQKKPNGLGLYDMSGNVWEWCADWYGDYPSSAQTNPKGPASGLRRVNRGGSWDYVAPPLRVAIRNGNSPDGRDYYLGFRPARTP